MTHPPPLARLARGPLPRLSRRLRSLNAGAVRVLRTNRQLHEPGERLLRGALHCTVGVLSVTSPLWAANGMVSPGNGSTQLGMAGAGTAMAQDAAATQRNPAAGAWLGTTSTVDLGVALPDGGYEAGPTAADSEQGIFEVGPGSFTSVEGVFPVPAYAYNRRIDERTAWGFGVTAAGLKSLSRHNAATYARGIRQLETRCDGTFGGGAPLPGSDDPQDLCGNSGGPAGTDLAQVFLSAHWARRLTPGFSLGLAPVLVGQRLVVRGLGAFAPFSIHPDATSEEGSDLAFGGGLRTGLLWEVTDGVGLGLAYQSRIWMTDFDKYRGMVIGGALDLPPIIDAGLQLHLAPSHRLLLDVEHIAYSQIKPLGNTFDTQRFTDGCLAPRLLERLGASAEGRDDSTCLGGANGPGFGWTDMTIYKLGYQWQRGRLKLRAGVSLARQPLPTSQILSAVFAPAITERHEALGLSWALSPRLSVDAALVHAARKTLTGRNPLSNVVVDRGLLSLNGFDVAEDDQDQVIHASIEVWQSHFGLTWRFD